MAVVVCTDTTSKWLEQPVSEWALQTTDTQDNNVSGRDIIK